MKVTLYIPDRLYVEAKRNRINMSRMLRDALLSYFNENNIQVGEEKYRDSPVVLLVRCPHCGLHFTTTSVRTATCRYCRVHFSIFPRSSASRVVRILKGTVQDIARLRGNGPPHPFLNNQ